MGNATKAVGAGFCASGFTICVDGNVADWAGLAVSPSYPDNATDAGGGSGDITAIRITSANSNLYVRWDEILSHSMVQSDGFSISV